MFVISKKFTLSGKYEINRNFLKFDYIIYNPSEKSTKYNANCQVFIHIPWKYSVISLLNSYLDINFDVLHTATGNRYVDDNDVWLINLGAIAFLSTCKSTPSSGRNLEDVSHAHIVSLMFK